MLNAEANYDNKEKLTFSNKLEMRLGFQSSQSDTQHEYKTNADQIRLTNKLGLQAAKRWYYTVMLQSWTQFYPGYQANDPKVYSDFMSPFESVLSVGMDYKYKKGSFELSATLSPIAADYKYVDRLALAGDYAFLRLHKLLTRSGGVGKHVRAQSEQVPLYENLPLSSF